MTHENNAGNSNLEEMDVFFNKRASSYDDHMLVNLNLSEFYQAIADCFEAQTESIKLLDLGCGTGIQLERLFEKCPNLCVTGIDLSEEMLKILKSKFSDRQVYVFCQSFINIQIECNTYDYVLSTYSLHHYVEKIKADLYRKIYDSLRNGGVYIEGDYTAVSVEKQQQYYAEYQRVHGEMNGRELLYHLDIPLTAETTIRLLAQAGFSCVRLIKQWENTSIITAVKREEALPQKR